MRLGRLLIALTLLAAPAAAAPEQVHLGIPTEDPSTTMSVVWWEATPNADAKVVVETPEGEKEFAAEEVAGPSAGFVYEARLTDLAPNATYAYRVGERAFELTTPSDAPAAFRVVAIGDMGITENSRAAVDTILELDPDLVIHAGDVSYAEGNQVDWRTWFEMVEPVAAKVPWMIAIGNHETGPAGTSRAVNPVEVAFYQQRFSFPGNELWYSFDWGGVHFVALDTYSAGGPSQVELDWLKEDLAASAEAAWTVAYLHEPPYSSNSHGSSARVQDAFVPLFEEFGVDLVVAAHDHGYERSYPMMGGEPTSLDPDHYHEGDGVVYVVTGGGGQSLYSTWEEPAPEWSAARESLYHVTELTVTPDAITARVVPTTSGEAFEDAFVIEKPHEPVPPAGTAGSDGLRLPAAPPALVALAVVAGALLARRR